jgi:hypothetical protein
MPTADDMHKKASPLPPVPFFYVSHFQQITRVAAGKYWQDPSMADWPDSDYRLLLTHMCPTQEPQPLGAVSTV